MRDDPQTLKIKIENNDTDHHSLVLVLTPSAIRLNTKVIKIGINLDIPYPTTFLELLPNTKIKS